MKRSSIVVIVFAMGSVAFGQLARRGKRLAGTQFLGIAHANGSRHEAISVHARRMLGLLQGRKLSVQVKACRPSM